MTSRERMLAAMRSEEPDRPPIFVWGVEAWDEGWVASRDLSYGPVIEAALAHCDFQTRWGPSINSFITASDDFSLAGSSEESEDWVLHTTTLRAPAGELTSSYRSSKRGLPGMQGEFLVKRPEDVDVILSIPYIQPRPECDSFATTVERMGDRGIVMVTLSDPITYVHELMGSELLAIWSIERRDLIMSLLELFTERLTDLVRYLVAQGLGPVYSFFGSEYAGPPLHGPRDFAAFVTAFDSRLLAPIREAGGLCHVHCHGPVGALLEEFVTMGAHCLHPVEPPPMGDVTLAEAKRRLAGRVCIEGNIQVGDVYAAPTEQLREQVRESLRVGAPGGGFILSTTASPYTTVLCPRTVENYVAFVETAVERRN